eukprot:scaffold978_cov164-Amphora_coffeaeformis.AAC.9
MARLLMEHGADPNCKDSDGSSSFVLTCAKGFFNVIRELRGADPNLANNLVKAPFHAACLNGHFIVAKEIHRLEGDPNVEHQQGETPLHCACKSGNRTLISWLMKQAGAETRPYSKSHFTPFEYAFKEKIMPAPLIELGFDPYCAYGGTRIIVHSAMIQDYRGRYQDCHFKNRFYDELLKYDPSLLHLRGKCDATPLHYAAEWGCSDLIPSLLQLGANATLSNCYGDLPFFPAAIRSQVSDTFHIIRAGAGQGLFEGSTSRPENDAESI